MKRANELMRKYGVSDLSKLHRYTVDHKEEFWSDLFSIFEVSYSGSLTPALSDPSFLHYHWFENTKLNFAKNLLNFDFEDKIALEFIHESGFSDSITYGKLNNAAHAFASFLSDKGLKPGDVVAAYMPNHPASVVAMLGVSLVGGVFTSTSCDFGSDACIDRFLESNPKFFICANAYTYQGKLIDQREKIAAIRAAIPSIRTVIDLDFLNTHFEIPDAYHYHDIISSDKKRVQIEDFPFSHPLYILYSSGTTGKPKAIVHSAGGTLLKHLSELGLHVDITSDDKIFFFTTCGWMMWNWLISALYFKCTIVLYEGSPTFPSPQNFLEKIDKANVTIWGTSPKFLKVLENLNITYPLLKLHTLLSTGAPLYDEQYDYVYHAINPHLSLLSISGGTDILGCFFIGFKGQKIIRGEIPSRALGMDVVDGPIDEEMELICNSTFPSRPIYFLNDPDGSKFHKSYFSVNSHQWYHGDFIRYTKNGGVVVLGRSDATLNPQGVRIGTAEIYRVVESIDWIADSLCIASPIEGDVEILLFIKKKIPGNQVLENAEMIQIKKLIKTKLSPRHVPAAIYSVGDIPYTRSGKKLELLITRLFQKRQISNLEAVANPECLEEYQKIYHSNIRIN